ncbi:MAG: hypothetical protein J0L55_16075, partial [Caulobacterales bacterium]|nr:hypothetical protein [Caulobacterales bacterium]
WCRHRMAAYKVPREVWILPELPKTPSGKILKKDLRGDNLNLLENKNV